MAVALSEADRFGQSGQMPDWGDGGGGCRWWRRVQEPACLPRPRPLQLPWEGDACQACAACETVCGGPVAPALPANPSHPLPTIVTHFFSLPLSSFCLSSNRSAHPATLLYHPYTLFFISPENHRMRMRATDKYASLEMHCSRYQ